MSFRELRSLFKGKNHEQLTQVGEDGIGTEPKGIIRKTTITQCGHGFCKECIEKYLRHGNNKCPSCRVDFPSCPSFRANEYFDEIVSKLYADNNQYENEELELNKTEQIPNEQVKATTISQTRKRRTNPSRSKQSTTVETPRGDKTVIQRIPVSHGDNGNNIASSSHHMQLKRLASSQSRDSNKNKRKDCVRVILEKRAKKPIRRQKKVRSVKLSEFPDTQISFRAKSLSLQWGRRGLRSPRMKI
ncbi:putative E3 ubiquitin-protein ligase RING1a [Eutrema salsugineum]|uniref:putative E3 ubiquitin-protein ligase RING1a n=1 Tax=Eutrema salsugineum TaxID=72664 RepID=UPI000CED43EB|nr:putative E3 ubiquitin-protein ligase RING1a [Eutrema salsugineum]